MDNQTIDETMTPSSDEASGRRKKHKKKHTGLFLLLLLLILAVGAGTAYYFMERQKPIEAVEKYLSSIQKMDFATMEEMLQSKDLSLLEDADIRNHVYADFFQNINSKMTYSIRRTDFDIQNGTALVTARIRYIDGTEIYRETVSDFLRQIVSTAFSGKTLTEEEIQDKLASILTEKANSIPDSFSESDIVYPVIKTDSQWKVVSLDDETVKIMSANIKSVENEINQSLEDNGADNSTDSTQVPSASEGDSIDMVNDKFTVHYTRHVVSKDFAGAPCLLVYYDYANNGATVSSAMVDVNLQAFQNGQALEAAIPETNDEAIDYFMEEIQPGQKVTVCQAFSLIDMSDVTLQASDAFSFGGGIVSSQILKLQ